MARVVVLGSSNTDMTVRLPRLPSAGETLLGGTLLLGPGGKGANQAVAARRAGGDVVFLTAVGDDGFGQEALDRYRQEGIDISHVKVVPGDASGVALIFVGETGENMIGVAPGANSRLTPEDIDRVPDAVFESGGVFLASLEVPLETVERGLRRARARGMTTILNPAPVEPLLESGQTILALVDLLTPNTHEAKALTGIGLDSPETRAEAAAALQRAGPRDILITLGAVGCLLRWESRPLTLIPAFKVAAVDTVGAGDVFNGALAASLAEGRPLDEAAVWACAASALSVTRPGAQGASPRRAEIHRLATNADNLHDGSMRGPASCLIAPD